MSYNLLAPGLIERPYFPRHPAWKLSWEYRRRNLLSEILHWKSDIICLQEVEADGFAWFSRELAKAGYSGEYKQRTGDKVPAEHICCTPCMKKIEAGLCVVWLAGVADWCG